MWEIVQILFGHPLPAWVALAGLAAMTGLAVRLGAAQRQLARHDRIFAKLDGWAEDVDRCLDIALARPQGEAGRDTVGKVIPFPRRAQF